MVLSFSFPPFRPFSLESGGCSFADAISHYPTSRSFLSLLAPAKGRGWRTDPALKRMLALN